MSCLHVQLCGVGLLTMTLLLGCGAVEREPAAPPRLDPQSTVEPRSTPGLGQRQLARMVGEYSVAKTFHGRDGRVANSKGECRQALIQGDRFLESRFVFVGDDGESNTGLGLIGYDSKTARFTSLWIDSRSTRMSFRQSDPVNDADMTDQDQIVLHGRGLEGAESVRQSRTVTRIEADGARVVHRQYSPDGAGERLVMELVMTRRSAPH